MTTRKRVRLPDSVRTFDVPAGEVAALLAHARRCAEHRPTFAQMFEGRYRKDGRDIPYDAPHSPRQDEVDLSKIPPAVWLVKDEGVYLMSNGLPLDKDENGRTRVVYLPGFHPEKDEGWHQHASEVFGGDDFAVALPAEDVEQALAEGGKTLTIGVDREAIYLLA